MTGTGGAQLGNEAAQRLAALDSVPIEPGLSDDELTRVERELGFEFADEHRSFLAAGLPVGAQWPNWRSEGRRSLTKRVQLPVEGVLFAVEWSDFWSDGWGKRPARMKDALRTARYRLARVPQMIPVYSHHYLPGGRGSSRHPVLSVVQTDVVLRGTDLADYIGNEFGPDGHRDRNAAFPVEFWSGLAP
ncbi:hypothetical protein C6A85_000000109685 [Mycobacterium sp. ITM-2017-0098]|nr:hypothetical protein C6A85_000000109685 [Mycobacterium sp. ITM-2017-0098]